MINDDLYSVDINIPEDGSRDKVEEDQTPIPINSSNTVGSTQSTQSINLQDDEIGFYNGMSFNNKGELVTSCILTAWKKILDSRRWLICIVCIILDLHICSTSDGWGMWNS